MSVATLAPALFTTRDELRYQQKALNKMHVSNFRILLGSKVMTVFTCIIAHHEGAYGRVLISKVHYNYR